MPLWRPTVIGGGLGIGSTPSEGEVVTVKRRLKDVKINIFRPDSRDARLAGPVEYVADILQPGSRNMWPVESLLRDEARNGRGLGDAAVHSRGNKRCR